MAMLKSVISELKSFSGELKDKLRNGFEVAL